MTKPVLRRAVRQGGSPSFFIAGQPHGAFSGSCVASFHEPAAQGRLLLVRDSFKSRGPKYPPGPETEFRIISDFLSQMAMARAKGGSGIENIDHAKRERGQPCQTDAEKEGIQPTAQRNNGTHTIARFGFRVASWVWPPPNRFSNGCLQHRFSIEPRPHFRSWLFCFAQSHRRETSAATLPPSPLAGEGLGVRGTCGRCH